MKTMFKEHIYSIYLACIMMFVVTLAEAKPQQLHSDVWNFRVFLNDREIGYHTVRLAHDDNKNYVSVRAKFDFSLFFVSVYSYEHVASEVWQGGCISKISSETDDNGDRFYITGSTTNNTLQLKTHQGEDSLKGCVRTFAYWNVDLLKSQRLLNTQTGEYQPVELIDLGTSQLNAGNETISARQYRLEVEDMTLDLWYSHDNQRWLALEATTDSGARLRYLPGYLFESKKI